jgi:hypothetical protein
MKANGKRPPGRRLSLFAIDVEAEEQGTWETLASPLDCFEVRVRSLHCEDVQDYLADQGARDQRANGGKELTGKQQAMLFRRAVGELVLVDWRGMLGDDGKPLAFSRALAREILTERKWRHIADAISSVVIERSRLRLEEDAAEGKESEPSSVTVSS